MTTETVIISATLAVIFLAIVAVFYIYRARTKVKVPVKQEPAAPKEYFGADFEELKGNVSKLEEKLSKRRDSLKKMRDK